MGYDYSVRYMDMSSQENATEVTTVLDWAQERGELVVKEKVVVNVVTVGMKTGFVTTTRMSHATPAALYSKLEINQIRNYSLLIFDTKISQDSQQVLGM